MLIWDKIKGPALAISPYDSYCTDSLSHSHSCTFLTFTFVCAVYSSFSGTSECLICCPASMSLWRWNFGLRVLQEERSWGHRNITETVLHYLQSTTVVQMVLASSLSLHVLYLPAPSIHPTILCPLSVLHSLPTVLCMWPLAHLLFCKWAKRNQSSASYTSV